MERLVGMALVEGGGGITDVASRTVKNRNGVDNGKHTDISVTAAVLVEIFLHVAGSMSTVPCT
jgi:uncharacterized membrane protein